MLIAQGVSPGKGIKKIPKSRRDGIISSYITSLMIGTIGNKLLKTPSPLQGEGWGEVSP